jgi:YD repeat-containing protein
MKRTLVVAACVILAGVASVAWLARHASGPDAEHLEFYPEGRLKSRTTANGDKIRYEYGQSGRLAKVMYSPWSSIDLRYNGADDIVAVRDKFGTSRFERDPFGRLGKYVSSNGQELAYEYDPWGRVISVSVSGGSQVRYGHDIFGRLTSVNDGHGLTTYEYREREVVRRLPNGVKTIYSFSADRHLTSIVHRKANDSLLCSFGYVYRADGKLLETNEETSAGQTTERYEYDLLGRLANVQRSDGSRIFYAYDSMGNRVSETSDGHTTSYEYDAHGRLARKGSEVYQYDNAGNLLSKRDQARGRSGEYEYDADNNLVKVRGPKTVRYAYDGLGHRIKREGGGNTDYYLNDLSHGLAQTAAVFDGSGNLRVQYILADS